MQNLIVEINKSASDTSSDSTVAIVTRKGIVVTESLVSEVF